MPSVGRRTTTGPSPMPSSGGVQLKADLTRHFLRQKHTRTHIRRRQFSDLTSQPKDGGGYRDPIEVAREKTDWILENLHPEPLAEAQQAELKRILQAAEREMGG